MKLRQIIALGGGGFSMEPDNPLLDLYILKQANKTNPKICFIPTASGDADNYIQRFYKAFHQHKCEASHLSLFSPPTRDLESYILSKDIIYVGGGNTKNLLALWKEWGLNLILKKAWEQGVILAGLSAGSLCWFEQGVTDSFGEGLEPIECLGFLKGSHCPHYDGEINRRSTYHKLIASQVIQGGIAADDGVAIHYIDSKIHQVVCSKPNAKAYEVVLKKEVEENALSTVYLGDYSTNLV